MQKLILWLLKALVAGVAAFAVLCGFSLFYDNVPPATSVKNSLNDYPSQPNYFYCYLLEGFGYGVTDKNGYMNLPDAAANDKYDVLVMGSSHMEAVQMSLSKNAASILDANLDSLNVYNIALSGRSFLHNVQNIQAVLNDKNPKYLAIEITNVSPDINQIELVLANELPEISPLGTGIKQYLQKLSYLRMIYHQYSKMIGVSGNLDADIEPADQNNDVTPVYDISLLAQLIDKLGSIADENGTKLIIFHHHPLLINEDGSVTSRVDPDSINNFAAACDKAGIAFVDMTGLFIEAYNTYHILPHGFFNSTIGTGHLNEQGHKMIGTELSRMISEMEAGR